MAGQTYKLDDGNEHMRNGEQTLKAGDPSGNLSKWIWETNETRRGI